MLSSEQIQKTLAEARSAVASFIAAGEERGVTITAEVSFNPDNRMVMISLSADGLESDVKRLVDEAGDLVVKYVGDLGLRLLVEGPQALPEPDRWEKQRLNAIWN